MGFLLASGECVTQDVLGRGVVTEEEQHLAVPDGGAGQALARRLGGRSSLLTSHS